MDILSFILGYTKGKALGGSSGGGTSGTDIFPLTTVSGFVEDTADFVGIYYTPALFNFEIKEGEVYYVEWDGITHICKGIAATLGELSGVYLGNGTGLGLEGNNEPFIIFYTANGVQFISFESDESHEIRIYQVKDITVKPFVAVTNGTYIAPEGVAYSPVTVSVAGGGGTVDFPYDLKEILPPTPLTFEVGVSELFPNTPAAILADKTAVADMDVINNGESGLIIWDGALYAAYAGQRKTSNLQLSWGTTTMSIVGAIGNIGIPSAIMTATVVENTKSCGSSDEPFLVVANTSHGFQVAIPEDSDVLTHTIQIFKFVDKEMNE